MNIRPATLEEAAPVRTRLVDLTSTTCRWPLWESHEPTPPTESAFYCGEPVNLNTPCWSYCAEHALLANRFPNRTTPVPLRPKLK